MRLFAHPPTPRSRTAFTLIEVIVAMTIVAVLAAVAVVSYSAATKTTRDARRKKDLSQLQSALEAYKLVNGAYPAHGCSSNATWPGCQTPWIPGLTSTYVDALPSDPNPKDASAYIPSNANTYTYNYRYIPATQSYQLITRLENTSDPAINGTQFGYSNTAIYVVTSPR